MRNPFSYSYYPHECFSFKDGKNSKIQSQNIDREKHVFACMLAIHFHWTLVKTTISFAFIFLVFFVSKIELAWTKQDLFFNSKFRRSHVSESGRNNECSTQLDKLFRKFTGSLDVDNAVFVSYFFANRNWKIEVGNLVSQKSMRSYLSVCDWTFAICPKRRNGAQRRQNRKAECWRKHDKLKTLIAYLNPQLSKPNTKCQTIIIKSFIRHSSHIETVLTWKSVRVEHTHISQYVYRYHTCINWVNTWNTR